MTQPATLEKLLADALDALRRERAEVPPERPPLQYDVIQFATAVIPSPMVGDNDVTISLLLPRFRGHLLGFVLRVLEGGPDLKLRTLCVGQYEATGFQTSVDCAALENLQPKGIDLPVPVRLELMQDISATFEDVNEPAKVLFVLRFWTDQQRQLPVEER